jgi:hypothetical protein
MLALQSTRAGDHAMAFDVKAFLTRLETAGIDSESGGTGQYKGDHYVCAGSSTPHLHVSKSGNFVGLKKKQGAITTLVKDYFFKIDAIRSSIDDLKEETTPNDKAVTEALRCLAREHKERE